MEGDIDDKKRDIKGAVTRGRERMEGKAVKNGSTVEKEEKT